MIRRTVRNRNQVTFPSSILKTLGIGEGDEIGFTATVDGKVIITPLVITPAGAQPTDKESSPS
ncbi:AbrB/MazE/SpoVT family DNA-binding domain-containing protein [Streptomyces sp. NPDC000927]|uniref:AbrB/MazE/SpoVT family DNA-binding domain-containing protein n=1 Tax=Streptomyces sp. NPDC000927 TaxID=3154371 RepID=UPI00332BF6C4